MLAARHTTDIYNFEKILLSEKNLNFIFRQKNKVDLVLVFFKSFSLLTYSSNSVGCLCWPLNMECYSEYNAGKREAISVYKEFMLMNLSPEISLEKNFLKETMV